MRQSTANAYVRKVHRRYKAKPPKVRIRRVRGLFGWHGRFVPNKNEIHLSIGTRVHEKAQRALLVHETTHSIARVVERRRKGSGKTTKGKRRKRKSRLTYHGQHDRHFYGVARELNRRGGIDPRTAMFIESSSGYRPPKSWKRAVRRGKWR